jgi:hypothetical protein
MKVLIFVHNLFIIIAILTKSAILNFLYLFYETTALKNKENLEKVDFVHFIFTFIFNLAAILNFFTRPSFYRFYQISTILFFFRKKYINGSKIDSRSP